MAKLRKLVSTFCSEQDLTLQIELFLQDKLLLGFQYITIY
jgi:hypothetical protein